MNEAQDSSDMAGMPSSDPISKPLQSGLAGFLRSEKYKSILVRITLFVDGMLGAAIGYAFLILMALTDPADFDVSVKQENIRLGMTVYSISLLFPVLCLIILIFWKKSRRIMNLIAGGILSISLIGGGIPMLCALFAWLPAFMFDIEVFLNSLVFIIIALALVVAFWWLNISALRHIFSKETPPQIV